MPDVPANDLIATHFWASAKNGELVLPFCESCQTWHFYPRPFCPHCWSENVTWRKASGDATLHSYSIVRDKRPYVLALVDLAEGPRMMSTIIDCAFDDLMIGAALRVDFCELEGAIAPVFRLNAV